VQLYLIRHPPPQLAPGICYGQTDLPLAVSATEAAHELRPRLPADIPVFTSPLQRCRLLAEALHRAPMSDERLRELNFGNWEMQPWHTIGRAALDAWAADPLGYRPPNGECVDEFSERVRDFVAALQSQGLARAAIVTHAGVMKVVVGDARRLRAEDWMGLKFDYGELVQVDA